jgi:hypothetical protein
LKIAPPNNKVARKRTRKMKKRIFAMDAAPASIPVNPKMPATIAITRKMAAHLNIVMVLITEI